MPEITPFFVPPAERPANAAIFMSGSGSNAERILEVWQATAAPAYDVVCLVTDRPDSSRTGDIAARFSLPVVAHDIRSFYHEHGQSRVSLGTPEGRRLRRLWTDELRQLLTPYAIDFGILAGFVPLTNLTGDFPCLNVHPGDLTYAPHGRRLLVGLHTIPIERAILAGLDYLRSSVIIALPYSGSGEDMDNGPLLGVSEKVPVDFCASSREELAAIASGRPERRPPGGYGDRLSEIAAHNQERLKAGGDLVVFPPVVADFAGGRFGRNAAGTVHYLEAGEWHPVAAVVYGQNAASARMPVGRA